MTANEIRCSVCGAVLERHGARYTLTIAKVPARPSSPKRTFDLCIKCAAVETMRLARDGR